MNYSTEKEVWKDIEGYEGLYQVSNLGRVKRLARKARKNSSGYFRVALTNMGIKKDFYRESPKKLTLL